MLSIFDGLRDITLASVAFRLILSTLCGGIVGMEREFKRRSAGFRTHILICLGAAMTTLTSEFWLVYMRYYLDAARLGAGVVAGMGFIGAGTIIVTRRQRVKGLTTAAGLWTVAVVGLAIGAGFYEGGVLTTVLILLAEMLFSKLEYHIMATAPEINLFIEYEDRSALDRVLKLYRDRQIKVSNMEITRQPGGEGNDAACALFTLRLNKHCPAGTIISDICAMGGGRNVVGADFSAQASPCMGINSVSAMLVSASALAPVSTLRLYSMPGTMSNQMILPTPPSS